MNKTWLSLLTALVLAVISLGLIGVRHYVLGEGIPRAASWKVTMTAAGELGAASTLTIARPPDFRRQHVFDERFQSNQLTFRTGTGKDANQRQVTWRPATTSGPQPFRLSYSFRCLIPMRQATPIMSLATQELDASPSGGVCLKPGPGIECDHQEISRKAYDLVQEDMAAIDQVQAFFQYVEALEDEPTVGTATALDTLRSERGDSGGKSRLLVALCRNRGIPARLFTGLILEDSRDQGLHYWAEAWVNDHWLPMCPGRQLFGRPNLMRNYLVLHVGDDNLIQAPRSQVEYSFRVQDLGDSGGVDESGPLSAVQAFWEKLSLLTLRPAAQHLVQFMLLIPVAALIVSMFRTLVGVPTFGTFSPALLGLAFLDLKILHWGLGIFILTVLIGWGMRRVLDRYHLLQVPRVGILLTLIVIFLMVVVVIASHQGVTVTQYVGLFPLVILTHLVERFWTVETEDSTAASFKTLLGTLVVAVAVSATLALTSIGTWMFHYPETLGLVLAAQFVLGRYTGYRLFELYRFQDLIVDEQPEVSGARVQATGLVSGNGSAGDSHLPNRLDLPPARSEPIEGGKP